LVLAITGIRGNTSHPTAENCTWHYFEQPLSHFARGIASTYKQRVCIYSDYWKPDQGLPIFFYTGNESPVDEYVNNTGLIWDLAASEQALVVFAEHRYFGESVPQLEGVDNCLAFLSSEEALADYASLANRLRREWGGKNSAIIAFGGSYGGMLASWMRILYPSAVDGGNPHCPFASCHL
jgi:lysosomal Pro-X carboxypeptidase